MKKKFQRLVSAGLAVCMLAAFGSAALAADVDGHAEQEALEAFIEAGYLTGYEDGSYAPDSEITGAELVVLINRVAGISALEIEDAGHWYTGDLAAAAAAGYLDEIEPDEAVSAAEAAALISAALGAEADLGDGETVTRAEVVAALYALTATEEAEEATEETEEAAEEAEETEETAAGLEAPEGYYFVQMNIPYADFFAAEVENEIAVDAVSSATMTKTMTGTLVAGSYHVDPEGSDITGVSFVVAVPEGTDLSAYTEVTDTDIVTKTVTNRGTTSTTEYVGREALFENSSYAYYVLSDTDVVTSYKVLTVEEDGTLSFGAAVAAVNETLTDASATITDDSSYGDYQISVTSETLSNNAETVYAVVLNTAEGESYGLRHLENVWRVSELSWSTGYVTTVHGCALSYDHYVDIMGQTITSLVYYTEDGIYTIETELYVPVKFEGELAVADAAAADGTAAITLPAGFPEDYEAVYTVTDADGAAAEGFTAADGALTWSEAAFGTYTLTVTDAAGVYAAVSAEFTLTTDAVVAAAAEDGLSVVAAEGASEEDFAAWLAAIETVNVDGTDYAAGSSYSSVTVIDETGAVDFTSSAFTDLAGQTVTVTISATGYSTDVVLTVQVPETLSEAAAE